MSEYADEILNIINKIEKVLWQNYSKEPFVGLHSGTGGIILFYAYWAKFLNEDSYSDKLMKILEFSINNFEKKEAPFNLFRGLGGLGWVIAHLKKKNFIDADLDIVLKLIDESIMTIMLSQIRNKNYDFLHGALGGLLYLMERYNAEDINDYFLLIIKELKNESLTDDGNFLLIDNRKSEKGKTGFNLGLAHGIPGFIALLSIAIKEGTNLKEMKTLIKKNVAWLLQQKRGVNDSSIYPHRIPYGDKDFGQIGWCFGDLGVASSLYLAGETLNIEEWKTEAIDTFRFNSPIRHNIRNIMDAAICHGAISPAHLFNRIYQKTKIEIFKETSQFWYKEVFRYKSFRDGHVGFKSYNVPQNKYLKNLDLLSGLTGIGLSLISSISNIEPEWDRCLLLS